jgi:hypothetical protein
MAKKKTKIASLLQNNNPFTPGAVLFPVSGHPINSAGEVCVNEDGQPSFPPVKSIIFCRHAYGQGAAVDQPCYVISFEESDQSVVIPATELGQLTVQVVDSSVDENIPSLPE